jgi:L-malate glycosyltransferase
MKILMLNYEFPPIGGGGGNAHLCLLRKISIVQAELIVDVLTSGSMPGFTKEHLGNTITVYKVGIHKRNLHFWRRVEVVEWLLKAKLHYHRLITQTNYDLIHIFFGIPTGLLCVPRPTCPYIVSLRGSDVPGENARFSLDYKLFGPVLKKIWKDAAGLVACSEGLKQRGLRFFPQVKIGVIPNGVESEVFKAEGRRQKTEDRRQKLITVGRLSVTKRIDLLVDAVALLKKQGREIGLTIVGGGGELKQIRRLVEERGMQGFVTVMGRVDNDKMPELYRQHDLFVSATMQEGMSNAMLEAMASGLPIVTTRCEGVDELLTTEYAESTEKTEKYNRLISNIQHSTLNSERKKEGGYTIKDNGIIVENATAAEIAESIKKVIDHADVYQQMSKAARQQTERFSWQSVAEQYLNCYRTALQKSGV